MFRQNPLEDTAAGTDHDRIGLPAQESRSRLSSRNPPTDVAARQPEGVVALGRCDRAAQSSSHVRSRDPAPGRGWSGHRY